MNPGVLVAFLTYVLFSVGDATIKGLGDTPLSSFEISFFCALFAGLAMVFLKPRHERWSELFHMRHPRLLLVRSVSGLCATVMGVVSLITIPFSEAYALIFMAPFIATLMSVFLLRERVSLLGITATVLGFAGVLIAVRPGFRAIEIGHVTAAGAAFFVALSTVIIRRIAGTERRISLLVMPQLVTLVGAGAVMATNYVQPTGTEFGLLLLAGAIFAAAQLLLILAAQRVPASTIAQTQFSQLIWAIAIGALVFAEMPDVWAVVGAAVIIVAGFLTVRDRRV